jgi:hypothetical protein
MQADETLIFSAGADSLRIALACETDHTAPDYGQARLDIGVRSSGFAGSGSCWVDRATLRNFSQALNGLNSKLRGEAELHSMSKGEFALAIRQISARGIFAVEGRLARLIYARDHIFRHGVSFGFEIELSQIENAARQLAELTADTAWNVVELTRRNEQDL